MGQMLESKPIIKPYIFYQIMHENDNSFEFLDVFIFGTLRARLVCVFKNWKMLFENIYGNTCGWKSVLKCVKCCLKTENCCLKTQTKHPLREHNGFKTHPRRE